jgi:hypothetical protein
VHVVASSHAVTVLACAALDDVATGVSRFAVVSGGLRGRSYLVSLGRLGMNRSFSLLSGGLDELLRGGLASPRGRALGLLHGSCLEEFPDFISSPTGVGVYGSGMLQRSMVAATTFWLARAKTGGSTTRSSLMRRLTLRALSRALPPSVRSARSCSRVCWSRCRFSRSSSSLSYNS